MRSHASQPIGKHWKIEIPQVAQAFNLYIFSIQWQGDAKVFTIGKGFHPKIAQRYYVQIHNN